MLQKPLKPEEYAAIGRHESLRLDGPRYYVRTLSVDDVSAAYVSWLNDPQINRYMEVRFGTWNIENTREFVASFDWQLSYLFGIFVRDSGQHIGNCSLRIEPRYKTADIAFFVGEKKYWGHGAADTAIALLLKFSFESLQLTKVYGGCSNLNLQSIRKFEKFGFMKEGQLRKVEQIEGQWSDTILFGLLREEWQENRVELS